MSGSNSESVNNSNSSEKLSNNCKREKSQSPSSSDPFLQDFYNRKNKGPRLGERILNRDRDPFGDKGFEELRKQIEEERKMFFDSDPFGNFPMNRGGSPAPPNNAGSNSPRPGSRAGSGFPFEGAARSHDFPGSRHPMFSTMRRPAWEEDPFVGNNPFHRERHNSGSSSGGGGSSTASTGEEHIIPIRIEREDGSSSPATEKKKGPQNKSAPTPISKTPIPMPAPEGMSLSSTPEPPKMQHIPLGPQRSSTDEVRKSPSPAPGDRSRAQSAPPESVPVPKVIVLGGKNSKEQSPPLHPQSADGRPIPIVVEGRGSRGATNQRNGTTHNQMPQQQQQKASRPAEPRDLTPPPKKPTPPKDPLERVADITQDVKDLEVKVEEFSGTTRNKEYLYLDEMLTRNLIKLDVIETEGREDVRMARKDCIKLIQNCISKLEAKVPTTKSPEESMETEQDQVKSSDAAAFGDQTEPLPATEALKVNA